VTDHTPDRWRSEFAAFDADWSERNDRRKSSDGGVRETYYAAGYRAGSNDVNADLLAVAKQALLTLEGHRGVASKDGLNVCAYCHLSAQIETAIKKAGGEAEQRMSVQDAGTLARALLRGTGASDVAG